ncbi:unnamed protein product [Paramecium primaurelia]|uniref:Ankyrin repeat-containing domain n=1 Tax=Paramecium primaurelia TaxID=5886 RepID=A0A8S1M2M1_PARPR|nr:unnamed protein product [Paramecium primaurelia]
MNKKSLTQTERATSAAIGKTQISTQHKHTFMTQTQKTENLLNQIVEQECPLYTQYKQKNPNYPIMKIKEFKKPQIDPVDHTDYIKFKKMKNNFVKEYKEKLDNYFQNNTKYERRFFKIYHRKDQIYFKHKNSSQKNVENPEVTDMRTYNQILQMNQQQTQRANLNKQQEKRRRELKMEEKEEKEYIKLIMDKFLKEEQKYFDKLTNLEEQGQQMFQEKVQLRNKYTHDYIKNPQREFVEKKDLIISKVLQIPENLNSSVISNAGSQIQSQPTIYQANMPFSSAFSSFQQLPSLQNVLQRMNSNVLYQLPVPQIQEYDLQPGEQIKKPSTYQTQQILDLQRLITLNEKIEFTFRIVSEPSLLDIVDSNGCTLLHQAALKERNGIAKFLLIKGIDYKKTDNKGRTALDIAIKQKNQKLIDYINLIKKKGLKEIN